MPKRRRIAWTLWLPVLLAFLLIGAAWFTVIKLAAENPTQTVELQNSD